MKRRWYRSPPGSPHGSGPGYPVAVDLEVTFRDQAHLPSQEPILVACSGGADSTALAVLAARCSEALDLGPVTLAHLDHGLRADSADDAEHVRALAEWLEMPCVIERREVHPAAGESPEAAARRVRYAFLAEAALSVGATLVLTAHHADDQAETVLLRVLRGTGPAGLAGIRASRSLTPTVTLARPLLAMRAQSLRAYLEEHGVAWREDPTNRDGNDRARLRHRALPVLAACVERDPVPLLARLATIAAQAQPPDDEIVRRFLTASAAGLRIHAGAERLPTDVLRTGLAEPVAALRGSPLSHAERLRLVELIRGDDTESLAGLQVTRDEGGSRIEAVTELGPPPAATNLSVPGIAEWGRATLRAERVPTGNEPLLARLRAAPGALELADAAALVGELRVRQRTSGDRLHALGAASPARLGHLIQRRGLPASIRPHPAVVSDDAGIVWVPGVALAERMRVRPETEHLLVLSVD